MTPKSPATRDTEHLRAKIWKLLDELEEVRSADPGEGDWRNLLDMKRARSASE